MTPADFTIEGTPYAQRGYDATNGQTVHLRLENLPALDVSRVEYSVYEYTEGAPTLVFTAVPTPPTAIVPIVLPATGAHTWGIRAVVNDGRRQVGDQMVDVREWTRERAIAIRNTTTMLRKILPSEQEQYKAQFGWTSSWNDGVDATGGSATPLSNAMPADVGIIGAPGAATAASRGDHIHAHGSQGGGTTHAVAGASAGFMSPADKTKLDTYPATYSGANADALSVATALRMGMGIS
jgi:hypothetical protein